MTSPEQHGTNGALWSEVDPFSNIETRHFAQPDGTLAALRWSGQGTQRIVALHGWLDNAASFLPLVPHLEFAEFIALDLAGHGHSLHRQSYALVDYVADVLAVLDALAWSDYTVMGHSLGAGVASVLAAAAPHRVDRLVLLDGLGPLARPASHFTEQLHAALEAERHPPADPIGRAHYRDPCMAVKARIKAGDLDPQSASLLVRRALKAVPDGWRWRSDRRLRLPARPFLTEEQVGDALRHIRCPVLLLDAPDSHLRHWQRLIAQRQVHVRQLERASIQGGHHLHMTQPRAVAEAMKAFLHRHAATEPKLK